LSVVATPFPPPRREIASPNASRKLCYFPEQPIRYRALTSFTGLLLAAVLAPRAASAAPLVDEMKPAPPGPRFAPSPGGVHILKSGEAAAAAP